MKGLSWQHLEARVAHLAPALEHPNPPTGWIRAMRLAFGMTLEQLGRRLSITPQSVRDMEMREKEGSLTLDRLRKAAHALDMELVYGFVPREGTLEAYVERRARMLATMIVERTSQTMRLEDQENAQARLRKAIDERTKAIMEDLPRALWDQWP
jgi:predicted DNA-binding mobile mystery protein A